MADYRGQMRVESSILVTTWAGTKSQHLSFKKRAGSLAAADCRFACFVLGSARDFKDKSQNHNGHDDGQNIRNNAKGLGFVKSSVGDTDVSPAAFSVTILLI